MPYRFGKGAAAKEAERELGRATIVAVTQPIEFDRATTIKEIVVAHKAANTRHLEVGCLRTAYLLVFSLLGSSGYVFARSEALRPVREQILNPYEEIAPSLVRGLASGRSPGTVMTLRSNMRPFFWSVRFDDGACVFLPHGGSRNHYRQIAELPEGQSIRGWEWQPRKFGSSYVDRHRLLHQPGPGEDGLFTELRRRVQHYGFRYDYRGGNSRVPATAFPRWTAAMAERIRPHFGGALPVQCIVNEYRPGQGIGMHADHRDFGPVVASLSLGADWPMRFRLRSTRPYASGAMPGDEVAVLPPPLGSGPRRACTPAVDAWHRPCRQRARDRDTRLGDVPHAGGVAPEDEARFERVNGTGIERVPHPPRARRPRHERNPEPPRLRERQRRTRAYRHRRCARAPRPLRAVAG